MKHRPFAAAALLVVPVAFPPPAPAQCVGGRVEAAVPVEQGMLGYSLAVSGYRAFSGAYYEPLGSPMNYVGAVHVFEYGPSGFADVQTLYSPGPTFLGQFGRDLDAADDWLVVGSSADANGNDTGAGFVYRRSRTGWSHHQTLTSPNPYLGENLGLSVAMDDKRVVLGAPGLSTGVGSAYVFELQGGVWSFVDQLRPTGPQVVNGFGTDVAISGDRILVGAAKSGPPGLSPGAGYVFELQGGVWTQTARLVGQGATWSDVYGQVVALDGQTAVVTGWGHSLPGGAQGAAWVFEGQNGSWTETVKLVSTRANGSRFGASVDIDGDRILVGARSAGGFFFSQSFVELFRRVPLGWASELERVGPTTFHGIGFGDSVALWGDSMIVGNSSGGQVLFSSGDLTHYDLPAVQATAYCTATPNSTGAPARAELLCPGLLDGRLLLNASPVPNTPGLFVYGGTQASVPLLGGTLCVGGPLRRLPPVVARNNALYSELDLSLYPALQPGTNWNFQAYFRDPAGPGGYPANLSDGLNVILAP